MLRKNFVTKFKVPTFSRPLIVTFIRSIKATTMAIKSRQMCISCLSLFIVKLYDPSTVSLQSEANYLNQDLVIGSFLENGFEATLSSKTNAVSVWKKHFLDFCKFLSDEVETVFWESEAVPSRPPSKLVIGNFLENVFQSLFDHSRRSLLDFLNILNVSIWIFNWSYNLGQNILRLFDVLPNLPVTTSETNCDH